MLKQIIQTDIDANTMFINTPKYKLSHNNIDDCKIDKNEGTKSF